MTLWTSAEAAAATGGHTTRDWAATGVSIDTRTLQPGDLFVALAAARDGHEFVAEALARGASAAMVSRRPEGVAEDAPLLVVKDVLEGLTALGAAARARTQARVVGITGSAGKTSTKEMMKVTFAGQAATHVSAASYNNHWGVPLTLARMPQETGIAVIEIGMNHPGEIAPLARLARLDIAVITTVAAAHLEAFASVEEIAREKAAILEGLVPGGVAILPGDLPVTPILLERARALGVRAMTFGSGAADYALTDVQVTQEATIVQARHEGVTRLFKVRSPGRHFASNALATLAVADILGLDPTISACDLARWAPPPGRGTRERILLDRVEETSFELIDDAFNANPASMAAGLEVLATCQPQDDVGRVGRGRRIAILGDMLELGHSELDLHAAIARLPSLASVAVVHCVGKRMRALHAVLPRPQRGEWVETAPELAVRARSLIDAGDIVLVKGSKGSKVSLVVDALRKLGQAAPPGAAE